VVSVDACGLVVPVDFWSAPEVADTGFKSGPAGAKPADCCELE
jgi:hypothetical protein